jgi:hypothetical protein
MEPVRWECPICGEGESFLFDSYPLQIDIDEGEPCWLFVCRRCRDEYAEFFMEW